MSEITVNTRRIKLPFKASEEKPYIFASYGHNDKEIVFPIFKQLYEMGYNVWYDEGIEINTAYDNVIASHVKECSVFVLLVSRHSVTRPYVTENELGYASRLGKTILPLFIEDEVELPPGVDMLLKGVRFNSTNEIIAKIKQLGIKCYGTRQAEETEREISQGWLDEDETDESSTTKNLVSCTETPYAYIGIHPDERSVARAYIKELYNAGYNVRSFEYSDERERMVALASSDCVAFVPVLTKKYVESGMFEIDSKMARAVGKHFVGLMVDQRDENGNEITISLPQSLSMRLGGRQMLNERERTSEGFLTELEKALEKSGCCQLEKEGKIKRRSRPFIIPGFLYELAKDKKGIILTKYNGKDDSVVIKDNYGGLPVVEIGEATFKWCERLCSINIPNSVTKIGNGAFYHCTSLTSVSIPDSVTKIGNGAFEHCTRLATVKMTNNVKNISDEAFSECYSLHSITIPNGVTTIGDSAFKWCQKLTSVTIPYSATNIGKFAFRGCNNLTSIIIPDSVTSIDEGAFFCCNSLTAIKIPKYVKNISDSTFFECCNLHSITIPNGVTNIGKYAFCGCYNLNSVIIPDSVTGIGENAFASCDKLTTITIPDNLTTISNSTFCGCVSLSSVKIPCSVLNIGKNAFARCSNLISLTVPDSVTSIGKDAFSHCLVLTIYCNKGSAVWKYCKRQGIRISKMSVK